jgi:YVTN family beta-propeller protein
VAVDPVTDRVYVAAGPLYVIDGQTNTVIAKVPVGLDPQGVAVNSTTDTIYTANDDSSNVTVVNGRTNKATATIPAGNDPTGAAVNPATNTVYVTNYFDSTMTVINGQTNTVTATVPTGNSPYDLAVNPATNTIYVADGGDDAVSVISGQTNAITATIPVGAYGATYGVAVNPKLNRVYATSIPAYRSPYNMVSVINTVTNKVLRHINSPKGPFEVAANLRTGTAYVTEENNNKVDVLSSVPCQT